MNCILCHHSLCNSLLQKLIRYHKCICFRYKNHSIHRIRCHMNHTLRRCEKCNWYRLFLNHFDTGIYCRDNVFLRSFHQYEIQHHSFCTRFLNLYEPSSPFRFRPFRLNSCTHFQYKHHLIKGGSQINLRDLISCKAFKNIIVGQKLDFSAIKSILAALREILPGSLICDPSLNGIRCCKKNISLRH